MASLALGKKSAQAKFYSPHLLFSVPRAEARAALGLQTPLPFGGQDIWTAYELSWLNPRGLPHVAVGIFTMAATSPYIIESKSLKLYLNSLNATRFQSVEAFAGCVERDLGAAAGGEVGVLLYSRGKWPRTQAPATAAGVCLDAQDVAIQSYTVDPSTLSASGPPIDETLYSDLLKSNCPVTGQPDFASLVVRYTGPPINHEGLLKYIVSYRDHTGFHEQCVEQMFVDIMQHCHPQKLSVHARFTRRGGLDINPFRSNFEAGPGHRRDFRQ